MKELPMLLMGGSALLGSILSLVLPETLGSALPARWQDLMDEVSQLLEFVIVRFSDPFPFGSQAGTGPLSVSFLIRTSVKQARLAGPCLQRAHFRVLGSVQLTAKISGSKGPLTSNFIFKLDLHLLESV